MIYENPVDTISHPVFDVSHLQNTEALVQKYGQATGLTPTAVNTGSGSSLLTSFNDNNGPGWRVVIAADPGSAQLNMPTTILPTHIKAIIIDLNGITYAGTNSGNVLWGCGITATNGSVAEIFRSDTGVALTTQTVNSAAREQHIVQQGDVFPVKDGRAGIFIDLTRGHVTAHMGYSMVKTTTNFDSSPSYTIHLLRAVSLPANVNFNVTVKEIVLTLLF